MLFINDRIKFSFSILIQKLHMDSCSCCFDKSFQNERKQNFKPSRDLSQKTVFHSNLKDRNKSNNVFAKQKVSLSKKNSIRNSSNKISTAHQNYSRKKLDIPDIFLIEAKRLNDEKKKYQGNYSSLFEQKLKETKIEETRLIRKTQNLCSCKKLNNVQNQQGFPFYSPQNIQNKKMIFPSSFDHQRSLDTENMERNHCKSKEIVYQPQNCIYAKKCESNTSMNRLLENPKSSKSNLLKKSKIGMKIKTMFSLQFSDSSQTNKVEESIIVYDFFKQASLK